MRRFDVSAGGAAPGDPAVAGRPGAALNLVRNGSLDGAASVEQEINAARAPRFASQQPEETGAGLGPRRVPGAGLHPGNVAWGGAAATNPLPAVGSEAAEADLAAAGEAMVDSYGQADAHDGGPMPVAGLAGPTVDFATTPAAPPSVELGQPSVVGRPGDAEARDIDGEGLDWTRGAARSGSLGDPLGTAALASSPSGVVVPPTEHVSTENRLPIFEAVESDWFRRGRSGVAAGAGISGQPIDLGGTSGWSMEPGAASEGSDPEIAWAASAADQGWEAAAAVASPTTGGTTSAGLPRRVPQANLVPGSASPEPVAPVPARSAAVTRERFASFQRGVREGRAAVAGDEADSDTDDGSR
jgi:hypothetical protein